MEVDIFKTINTVLKQKIERENNFIFFVNKQQVVFKRKNIQKVEKEIDLKLCRDENDIHSLLIKEQITYKFYNNYEQGLKIIKKILQCNQDNIDARLDLIQIMLMFKLGTLDQCIYLIKECFLLDQDYWRIHILEIRVQEQMSLHDLFLLNKLKQNLEKYDENLQFYINYFQIYTDYYDIDEQQSQKFLNLIKANDLDFELIRKIAYIFSNLKLTNESIELKELTLRLNPKSFQTYENLGYLYRTDDNKYKALINLKISESLNDRSLIFLQNICSLYKNMNQFDKSNQYALRSIKLYKDQSSFYEILIKNYYSLSQKENAIYFSQKALKQFKNKRLMINLSQRLISLYFEDDPSDYEDFEIQTLKCYNYPKKVKTQQFEFDISQLYQE